VLVAITPSAQDSGTLTIAVTYTQARYALPQVVQSFRNAFPNVRIALQQSAPEHIAEDVLSGRADIGIATEGLSTFPDLVSFPCYRWSHVVVAPDMVLTAMDSDVIKQYVSLGMGVGIIASMAFDHGRDKGLRAIESSHLFAPNVTRLAVRRGAYLRAYAYHFIERFAPGFTRADIEQSLTADEAVAI
jgi:LysR family cys regulon transcriptional activator